MRNFINKYGLIIAISAFVLIGICYLFNRGESSDKWGNPNLAYFYDEENGSESIHPITDRSPLPGASGKLTMVLAQKFTSDNNKTSKIYYLQKYSEQALEDMTKISPNHPDYYKTISKCLLVRSPEPGSPWVPADSPEGHKILNVSTDANGKPLIPIAPP